MKKFLVFVLLLFCLVACQRDVQPPLPSEEEEEVSLPPARITDTIRNQEEKLTVFNMEYPSRDPYGKPVTLSGAIVVGDEVTKERPAKGLFLFNRFTIYKADECPSRGRLMVEKLMVGSGLIIISADLYGFGVTEDKPQAYCMANANGQASVDALMAARTLLADMGYSWDDIIFNAGYSQGGQTAIGALKVATEQYHGLRFTRTFAGGGLYDLAETYRQLVLAGQTDLPSAVIGVLVAYNEICKLGIPWDKLFKEPVLSHLEEWFFSKKYTVNQIEELIGTKKLSDLIKPELLDIDSDLSKHFLAVMEEENLCRGWDPWPDEKITLVHNTADNVVSVTNATNLVSFFEAGGVTVDSHIKNFRELPFVLPPHHWSALPFFIDTLSQICSTLGISLWIDYAQVIQVFWNLRPRTLSDGPAEWTECFNLLNFEL